MLLAPGTATERTDEWDGFWLRFAPWPNWQPDGFLPFADHLYRTHLTIPGRRQRVQEAWERIIIDLNVWKPTSVLGAVAPKLVAQNATHEVIQSELALHSLHEIFLLILRDSTAPRLDPRVTDALHAMEQNLAHPLSMRELTERAGLSYSRFAHIFKSELGVTPKRAQLIIRLRHAAIQLQYGDLPVGAIAQRTGFNSIFDFSRVFRRRYGISPSAYRHRYR